MKPVSTCRECPFAKMVNVGAGDTLPDLVAMACTVAPQTAPPTLMSLVGKTGLTSRPAWCPLPIVVHAAEPTLADDGPHTLPIGPTRTPRQLVALRAEAVHERQLAQRVATRTPCDECKAASCCPFAFAPPTFDGACVAPEGSPWR